jgi:hypothetical protein
MPSLRLKGKWSIRQRQGFNSNSDGIIYPLSILQKLSIGITLKSYLFYHLGERIRPQRGRVVKGSQRSPFLAINAKGGESIKAQSKRTAPPAPPYLKKTKGSIYFKLVSEFISKSIFNWYLIWFQNFKFV